MKTDEVIDSVTGEIVQVTSSQAMEAVAQHDAAALDVQVATAKKFPRSIQSFENDLETWCTKSQDIAESCFYCLPRGGRKLLGASVRFAEMVQAAYGNLVVETHILEEAKKTIVVSATCRDLERNVAARAEVVRGITGRSGRYDDSMIQTTIQAASAIARRNAIFSVVPRALWEPIYKKAQVVAAGRHQTFDEQRKAAIKKIIDLGCDTKRVKSFLGKDSKDITMDDVVILRLKARQIEEGQCTPDEAFPVARPDKEEAKAKAKDLTERISSERKRD